MATQIETTIVSPEGEVPELRAGDRLTRAEFLRRYESMPGLKKAELIEGVVYMPSPVSTKDHGSPQFDFITWLGTYRAQTPGVQGADNATVRLDFDNVPQPDGFLRVIEECGGQSKLVEGYVEGAPELMAEVAASSASYDLHDKLHVYRRNGVREYVVWRVWDRAIDWFVLDEGQFVALSPSEIGVFESRVFPGLWLDAAAMINGDLAQALSVLQQGLVSPEHAAFVARLQQADK